MAVPALRSAAWIRGGLSSVQLRNPAANTAHTVAEVK
jgi:hypothetical protein